MAGPQHEASQPKLPERLTGKNAQIECKLVLAFFLHADGGPASASVAVFVVVDRVMSFFKPRVRGHRVVTGPNLSRCVCLTAFSPKSPTNLRGK